MFKEREKKEEEGEGREKRREGTGEREEGRKMEIGNECLQKGIPVLYFLLG